MSNHFKIIVPFYNVEKWIDKCIKSIKLQDYKNFTAFLIDDISTDNTANVVKELIADDDRFVFIENKEKKYALKNIVEAIETSGDSESDIIVTLDGDDWFATKKALSVLNNRYNETGCIITYGSYIEYPSMKKGKFCQKLPQSTILKNSYRQNTWLTSHLRTFKRGLWNKINKDDLLSDKKENKFYEMTWDMAFMFPMLEMAGPLSLHIPETLYCYNRQNPLNDDKVNHQLQLKTEVEIRNKKPYKNKFLACNILGPSDGMSGIGNQLFCVATALSYAKDYNFVPYFTQLVNDSFVKRYKNLFYKNLSAGCTDVSTKIYSEPAFHYNKIDHCEDNLKITGYFQSEKYFEHNRDYILKKLNVKELKANTKEKYGDFSDYTSIHVRRGDYLKLSEYHYNLTMDYYKQCISSFDTEKEKFLIFSNDIEWCKDNFKFLKNVQFSRCEEDWEDIVLMSTCKNNIIANSSFSWWGAWLNENSNKKVIAPSKWFGPKFSHKSTQDLIPASWDIV